MSNQTSIYNEKKLAYYEATYKLSVLAKPQDVNLTLTAAHIYGLAYIMEQNGTKEGDPVYTRFSCGLEEITKIYVNENSKQSPLYIQCDTMNKGVLFRKRIIIPCLKNVSSIVDEIMSVKNQFDEKMEKSKERAKELHKNTAEQTPNAAIDHSASAVQSVKDETEKKSVSLDDKLKEFERMKKLSDSFFDSIPIPGKQLFKSRRSEEQTVDITASEDNASDINEITQNAADAPVTEASVSEAVPSSVREKTAESEPVKVKPDIRVTIDDLLQLNDAIDEDFLKNTEPPITGGKKNADKYLDEIGSDYKPAQKSSARDDLLYEELGKVELEDMNEYTPGRTDQLDLSDLDVVNKNDLLSDMTGAKVDLDGEVTPVERMDYVRKNHNHDSKISESIENIKVVIDEKPTAGLSVPAEDKKDAPELGLSTAEPDVPVAAEDAYIEDVTTADTETISAGKAAVEEIPEVKNVHIDFSTDVTHDTSLDDFQESVKKLKSMLDSDLITKEEFMAEKKKLLSTLY